MNISEKMPKTKKITVEDIIGVQNLLMREIEREGLYHQPEEERIYGLAGTYDLGNKEYPRIIKVDRSFIQKRVKIYNPINIKDDELTDDVKSHVRYSFESRKRENPNLNLDETIKEMSRALQIQDRKGIYSIHEEVIRKFLSKEISDDKLNKRINLIYHATRIYPGKREQFIKQAIGELSANHEPEEIRKRAEEHWDDKNPSLFRRIIRKLRAA